MRQRDAKYALQELILSSEKQLPVFSALKHAYFYSA